MKNTNAPKSEIMKKDLRQLILTRHPASCRAVQALSALIKPSNTIAA